MPKEESSTKWWAWVIFIIAIITIIIAIFWSFSVTSAGKQDDEDLPRQVLGVQLLWFFNLAALFVALFLCLCPPPSCVSRC